jgi:DNA-binding MarR family transcriptional regulator
VTLNISPEPSNRKPSGRARPLVSEVVDELTSWNPREFIAAFQRWHQGQVSLAHLNVLILLEANGPMAMGRLADALDISVASATGVVDRMESRGLVERRRDTDDRRVVLVVPAAGARAILDDIDKRRRQALRQLLGTLTDEQLSGLLHGHQALRAARAAFAKKLAARDRATTGETAK